LRRAPAEIKLSEIIRLVDGPLAPFGDADQLRSLITSDPEHRALYKVFLDVRDAAAKILEGTSVADLVQGSPARRKSAIAKKQTTKARLAAMVHPLDKPML
jgi:DNA-binding IscR family transcriptional regulator